MNKSLSESRRALEYGRCAGMHCHTPGKLVDVFCTPLSVTIFYFLFVHVFSDVTTEVYGYAIAGQVLWCRCSPKCSPPAPFNSQSRFRAGRHEEQSSLADVLSTAPRLVFFGKMAVFAGDTVNNYIVAKMKMWSRGPHLPSRFVAATFSGKAVNASIFYVFALGTVPAF